MRIRCDYDKMVCAYTKQTGIKIKLEQRRARRRPIQDKYRCQTEKRGSDVRS